MKPWMKLGVSILVVLIAGCIATGAALQERTALEARPALNTMLINTQLDWRGGQL